LSVDIENEGIHGSPLLIALCYYVLSPRPAYLRDVDEAVDPVLHAYEKPEIGEVLHLPLHHRARRIFFRKLLPGVGPQLLEAEGYSFLLRVDVQDLQLDD